jgi:hypothetical protein
MVMWFLKRPALYLQLLHMVNKALFLPSRDTEASQEQAQSRCAQEAVDVPTAIEIITSRRMPARVRDLFESVFHAADVRAIECPVKMGGSADLDLLYWIAEFLQVERVFETGVAYGWSSLALLLSIQKRPDSILVSTDMPYPCLNNDKYVGCVVPEHLRAHWKMIKLADRQGIPRGLRDIPWSDMCHYDSDKSYEGRMWAYPRLWKSLKRNGIFVSDDVGDNLAFFDFARLLHLSPIVVTSEGRYAGILVKL